MIPKIPDLSPKELQSVKFLVKRELETYHLPILPESVEMRLFMEGRTAWTLFQLEMFPKDIEHKLIDTSIFLFGGIFHLLRQIGIDPSDGDGFHGGLLLDMPDMPSKDNIKMVSRYAARRPVSIHNAVKAGPEYGGDACL